MQKLVDALKIVPEFNNLVDAVNKKESVAVTGIGQINRSHIISGLYSITGKKMLILCQDDGTAKRLQDELQAFLSISVPVLPSRELTLYDSSAVSRAWEQKRIKQLFDFTNCKTALQIASWDSISMRTIPPEVLNKAVFNLTVGQQYDISNIISKLSLCGYTRCNMVSPLLSSLEDVVGTLTMGQGCSCL